ncbi:ABC transporter permease [Haematobacter massiliensis]|uniref:ABC transporter permease n=1 Tax=Haematobacter massiliensis TaxID=195105 RepID=A0A086Y270_9RHOB|nr:ABC transporter permease subunit [Haematobacter massiliensis]KFI28370.1 ABC transporter permease [Haematobacter massiliensis]OWJ84691.1 ABC transporter permease [Haematobacter massiliensis]QBJ26344.1 ABC transporter permease subunit [Haematobacter massiliensis]
MTAIDIPHGGAVAGKRAEASAPPETARERLIPATARRTGPPRWLRRTMGPLLLLLLWHIASVTGVLPAEVLAGPATVVGAASALLASGELQAAIAVSLRRAMSGLAIGGTLGVALAVIAGLTRLGEDLVDAPMQMLRTVPNVALIPLLIIWFGIGEAPKVALIALATAFPLYLNVFAGIRGVDQTLIEAGRTLGLSRLGLVRHVVLPGALPGALVGLRYSLGLSWLALVFGEQINATAGIGYLMANAREFFQTDVIVVCLVVYALLGLAVDFIVRTLERIFLAWRPSFTGA